ncbi:hypothetical protein MKQ68_24300 [Chitinophaga horti]|uniref:DUF4402 domain-containing protein n=1 Tax=Chitinophaga horti TaxID=2920382 RepID=A0ABY6J0Y6_9BACT|nr:hypothetical protein [Chitinophaga horti]UYQ93208.1 hypothetical protein MKQ68_24300 [Chitinophaga horti]
MTRGKQLYSAICICLLLPFAGMAQNGPRSINDERDFLGFTTSNPPVITIATAAEYQNGKFSDAPSSILLAVGIAWTVSVRAQTATLNNGINTIPVNQVTIQVVGATFGTGVITLSTTNQVVASSVLTLGSSFNFRYTLKGGNHLLQPAGNYTGTVIFSTTGL